MAIATAQPQTSYDEWRDRRWRPRYAQVTVDSHRRRSWTAQGDRIVGDPVEYLRGIAFPRNLDVTYSDHSGYLEWRGWRGPDVPAGLGTAAWFGTVLLEGAGPLGVAHPHARHRRLSGGWAFLIAVFLLGGLSAS